MREKIKDIPLGDSQTSYHIACLLSIIEGEPNLISNLSNIAAYLFHDVFPNRSLNWVGFYLVGKQVHGEGRELILGPFQGKIACLRIPKGKGVCGRSWETLDTILIPNVHLINNHIACDSHTNSELVVPIIIHGECKGVLDIDCLLVDGLNNNDAKLCQEIIAALSPHLLFSP